MGTLESRITALEQRTEINEREIFFALCPAEVPALGWFFYHDGGRVDILRLPDETDEALRARAAAACRAANCQTIIFLSEIDPDEVNHYGLIVGHVMEPEAWETAAREQQAALTRLKLTEEK